MDKYTVKMFPQAYRDIAKIYEQALLVSNYADDAITLAEKFEKAKYIIPVYAENDGFVDKLNAEEVADTFKIIIPKIEKGEMKFFIIRDLFLNFDTYKGKIVEAIGKSTVTIKAGDMAALRTMYNSDTGSMNTVLEIMVKKGTLTDEQITEIKEQRKS